MNGLYYAIRTQIKKDDTAERAMIFRLRLETRPWAATLFLFFETLHTGAKATVALIYAAASSAKSVNLRTGKPIAIARFPNELKIFSQLDLVLRPRGVVQVEWNFTFKDRLRSLGFFIFHAIQSPWQAFRVWRLAKTLSGRFPLYVVFRAMETALTYSYFKRAAASAKPKAVFISTEGNPHGCALLGVGRALNIPLVFASHAVVNIQPLRLDCDLGLFYGEAALSGYLEAGSRIKQSAFFGFRESAIPIGPRGEEAICVCLSHRPNFSFLQSLLRELRAVFPEAKLIVRPHPQGEKEKIGESIRGLAALSLDRTLANDLERAFVTISGHSTVLLDSLKQGVPAIFMEKLDSGKVVVPEYVERGLIRRAAGAAEIKRTWAEIFSHYQSGKAKSELSFYYNFDETLPESLRHIDARLSELY